MTDYKVLNEKTLQEGFSFLAKKEPKFKKILEEKNYKISNKNYEFSGGLHGVGISVVNALSKRVEVTIRRDAQVHQIVFANGDKISELAVIDTCGKRNTGTSVHFWPDASYFDSGNFSVRQLLHVLRAKAVLCPGLRIRFDNKISKETKC